MDILLHSCVAMNTSRPIAPFLFNDLRLKSFQAGLASHFQADCRPLFRPNSWWHNFFQKFASDAWSITRHAGDYHMPQNNYHYHTPSCESSCKISHHSQLTLKGTQEAASFIISPTCSIKSCASSPGHGNCWSLALKWVCVFSAVLASPFIPKSVSKKSL